MKKLIVTIISLMLCVLSLLVGRQNIIFFGSFFYLTQLVFISVILYKEEKNLLFLLSPSYICILYSSLNFILGHYVISRGIGSTGSFLSIAEMFQNYESISFITIFFLLCNLFVFLAIDFKKTIGISLVKFHFKKNFNTYQGLVLIGVIFLLGFIEIDLSFFGGAGDYSYALKLGLFIILVYLFNRKKLVRYIYYLAGVILLLMNHYDDKRNILYAVVLIIFLELLKNKSSVSIRFKQLLISMIAGAFIFILIIISSITRGYGNYDVGSAIEATYYVSDYLKIDYLNEALVANFELASMYGNTSNAVDYVYKGEVELLYGSTFLKVIFLPIPKRIFPNKPDSMIDIYTRKYDPEFRRIGGSYPISIYGEAFWNFHLFALIFLFLIFYFINRLYLKMVLYLKQDILNIKSFFLLYMYITIIQFIRGSGLEMWLLYALISMPFSYLFIKFFHLSNESSKDVCKN